jgi:hypothetical protein
MKEDNQDANSTESIQELHKLDVDPGEICIPATLYDDLNQQCKEIANEGRTVKTKTMVEVSLQKKPF